MAKRGGVGWLAGAGMSKEVELHTITLGVLSQLRGRGSLRPLPTIALASCCDPCI